jgi:hypothetical protein
VPLNWSTHMLKISSVHKALHLDQQVANEVVSKAR